MDSVLFLNKIHLKVIIKLVINVKIDDQDWG